MKDDPIIAEIHQVREKLWTDSGCDLVRLVEMIHEDGERNRDRIVGGEEWADMKREITESPGA